MSALHFAIAFCIGFIVGDSVRSAAPSKSERIVNIVFAITMTLIGCAVGIIIP